jgi:hypothetical protein
LASFYFIFADLSGFGNQTGLLLPLVILLLQMLDWFSPFLRRFFPLFTMRSAGTLFGVEPFFYRSIVPLGQVAGLLIND